MTLAAPQPISQLDQLIEQDKVLQEDINDYLFYREIAPTHVSMRTINAIWSVISNKIPHFKQLLKESSDKISVTAGRATYNIPKRVLQDLIKLNNLDSILNSLLQRTFYDKGPQEEPIDESKRYNPSLEIIGTKIEDRIKWYIKQIQSFASGVKLISEPKLKLTGWELTTLPKEALGEILPQITHLDLRANAFGKIPKIIFERCDKLKGLNLANNYIDTIPKEIGRLSNLKAINLCGNPLTDISKELEKIESLRELHLSSDKIELLSLDFIKKIQKDPNFSLFDENLNKVSQAFLKLIVENRTKNHRVFSILTGNN